MKKITVEPFGKHLDTVTAAKLALKDKEYGILCMVNDKDDDWRMKFLLSTEQAKNVVESLQKAILLIESIEQIPVSETEHV